MCTPFLPITTQLVILFTNKSLTPFFSHLQDAIAENFGGPAHNIGTTSFSLDDTPDLSGKVAVITGGSEGIGYGVAYTLIKHNLSKLFILSRKREVFDGALASIASELGQEKADRVHWIQCDLEDWAQTAVVAEQIKESTDRLDILVNNSGRGIMTAGLTSYGVDKHMATNHMGHVVLTSHLLPLLQKTAEETGETVRISNQSSNLHSAAPKGTRFKSLEEINEDVGPNGQYGRSKLAGILYARYFDREVTRKMEGSKGRVVMNATHPGFVSTKQSVKDIHEPWVFPFLFFLSFFFLFLFLVFSGHRLGDVDTDRGDKKQIPHQRVRHIPPRGTIQKGPVRGRGADGVRRHHGQRGRSVDLRAGQGGGGQ